VWAATGDFVAIRDIKMCGCAPGFVHGLAMPRDRVIGAEDPRRPAGIWSFAWGVARQRIADADEIALVVNPPDARGQDQLHVHLVRLLPDARTRLEARAPARVAELDAVWEAAALRAAEAGIGRYGVLVTRAPAGGFLVVPAATSPEREFTASQCR
jgi:CDP-diacylglycerol pyrophosphatase